MFPSLLAWVSNSSRLLSLLLFIYLGNRLTKVIIFASLFYLLPGLTKYAKNAVLWDNPEGFGGEAGEKGLHHGGTHVYL